MLIVGQREKQNHKIFLQSFQNLMKLIKSRIIILKEQSSFIFIFHGFFPLIIKLKINRVRKILMNKAMNRNQQIGQKAVREKVLIYVTQQKKQMQNRQSGVYFQNLKQKNTLPQKDNQGAQMDSKIKAQGISPSELKILFDFYDQYGPKWSNFQQLMPGRNQNQLKNKFHSTIRSLCRLIISTSEQHQKLYDHISSSKISSKVLVDMYEGKKSKKLPIFLEFKKFKNFMKTMLRLMNFQVLSEGQKLERCIKVLGVEVFYKVYEELCVVLGKKKVSSGSEGERTKPNTRDFSQLPPPANEQISEKIEKPVKKESDEVLASDNSPRAREIEVPQNQCGAGLYPTQEQATYNEVMAKNNMDMLQKLYMADQMAFYYYPIIAYSTQFQNSWQHQNQNIQIYRYPQP